MEIFGYKIFKRRLIDEVFFNRKNFLYFFFSKKDSLVIFDVGANKGQSIQNFKKLFRNSKIHAFEPSLTDFKFLSSLYLRDESIRLNNIALGEREELKKLMCYSDSAQNSFFAIDNNSEGIRFNAHPKVTNCIKDDCAVELVQVQTIDNYIVANNLKKINILKVDVQGFEQEVLNGATNALKQHIIDIMIVEVSFDGVYGKLNSFSAIENILLQYGYIFWDISHIYKDISRGRTCWVDVVYIHEDFIRNASE